MAEFRVQAGEHDRRADVFVASMYPQFTRSALGQIFDKRMVLIAGKPIKASYKVQAGDRVEIDETYLAQKPATIELPVLYEDSDVLVINKPAGLLTHSKGALNLEASVASFIADKISDKTLAGNRAGIVHRLDRDTSGVIITAKTKAAQDWLQAQFSNRKAKKTYLAIVHGAPNPVEALIDAPIARNPRRPQTFYINPAGKPAQTEYKVIKTFKTKGHVYSLVELKPLTGRTHQLRVHLAYINHPIVGDRIYGQDDGQLYLHAAQLELTLPSKARKVFKSKPPAYFKEFQSDV